VLDRRDTYYVDIQLNCWEVRNVDDDYDDDDDNNNNNNNTLHKGDDDDVNDNNKQPYWALHTSFGKY
jgi:hypothetical protein